MQLFYTFVLSGERRQQQMSVKRGAAARSGVCEERRARPCSALLSPGHGVLLIYGARLGVQK